MILLLSCDDDYENTYYSDGEAYKILNCHKVFRKLAALRIPEF